MRPHAGICRVIASTIVLLQLSCCMATHDQAVDPDLVESIRWYTGEVGRVDDERARELLEIAAADFDALSTMWIARVYSTGRMGYPADKPRAVEIANSVIEQVEAMAHAGNSEAQFLMGTAFAEALGKSRDDVAAALWYRLAADNGHVLAAHNMGNIHFSGTGVVQDDAQAVRWWTLAAQAGDAIPQFRLGEMYEQGRGVEASLELAAYWYGESAQRGNQNAMAALARIDGEHPG